MTLLNIAYSTTLRLLLLVSLNLYSMSVALAETPMELAALYDKLQQNQLTSVFGEPVFVSSSIQGDRYAADAYGLVGHAFSDVTKELSVAANWCQFVLLHFNIKACTQDSQAKQQSLQFYAGRKFYEPPEKAYKLQYQFKVISNRQDYLRIVLSADEGPIGTSDYRIALDAIPVGNSTFLHFHSSYESSYLSRMATELYLETLGRDKVGFSIVGTKASGEPVFIDGIKGVVERNVMRYYLALKAYLDTSKLSAEKRFEARIKNWFDLTEKHALQLHELEREEYLQSKRKERQNQLKLQQELDTAIKQSEKNH